jgi:phage baseplate assembly protein W
MEGFSPVLPLKVDSIDGPYAMNKTALDSLKQDLKMLFLTNPGERMMDPNYGIGLRRFLFSQNTPSLANDIINRTQDQVRKYMKFVIIEYISVITPQENENMFLVNVVFNVPYLNIKDQLNLSLESN